MGKWEAGRSAKGRMSKDTIPCAFGATKNSTAKKHAASGEHPGVVRCLSGVALGIRSRVIRADQR